MKRETKVDDDLVSQNLHPILTWMRWVGIDLMDSPTCARIWRVHAVLCFLLHFIAELAIVGFWLLPAQVLLIGRTNEDFRDKLHSATSTFNYVLDFTTFAVYNLGSHVILLTLVRSRWSRLMTALRSCCESFLHKSFYIRLYRLSVVGALYTLIQVAGLILLSLHHHYLKKSTIRRTLVSIMSIMSAIYSTLFVVLFCLMSYISSALFKSIHRQVEQSNKNNSCTNNHPKRVDETLLLDFKRRHSLAIEVVVCLNDCFGWNLLITVSFLYVNIISSSFYIFGETGGMNVTYLSFGLTATAQLLALCLAADRITRQSMEIVRPILYMDIDRGEELVYSFMSQVSEGVPKLTALGYFNISKKLIPQAAGTTLTYFFILYQFHSLERQSAK